MVTSGLNIMEASKSCDHGEGHEERAVFGCAVCDGCDRVQAEC